MSKQRKKNTGKRPPQITLESDPINLNGKLTNRIFARCEKDVVHCDTIDVANASKRKRFITDLIERAESEGIPVDADTCEKTLLKIAHDSSLMIDDLDYVSHETEVSPDEVLDAFGIEVLGEQDDQSIVCWSRNTRKRWVIKTPAKWADTEILQAVGSAAKEVLCNSPEPAPEGCYSSQQLREAVALAAADAPRVSERRLIGQGVWQRGQKLLVVNGANANVVHDGKFRPVNKPRFKSEIIDFNQSASWTNQRLLRERIGAMNAKAARSTLRRVEHLLKQWNWSQPWDARVVSLLIPATIIQTCWSWRPLVSIIGPSDSGKSTLLGDVLQPLFGDWTIAADRSTEAGLRQAIAHHATPVIIDEFDQYRHRQQVFELFRTSSRGGKMLRGTANQQGIEFGVKHLAWFAAIESGDLWGQDRNRFIRLELFAPKHRGNLSLPSQAEFTTLGRQLVAVAIWAAPAAIKLADDIKGTRVEGVHGRLVESFSVPAAMDAVIRKGLNAPLEEALKALKAFLKGRASLDEQCEPDEIRILRDILAADVRVSIRRSGSNEYVQRTVGQILQDCRPFGPDDAGDLVDELAARGIRIVEHRSGRNSLFLATDMVREKLLAKTRWHLTRIDQILKRLPGAKSQQQRCAGQKPWGIVLPWPGCLDRVNGKDNSQDSESP